MSSASEPTPPSTSRLVATRLVVGLLICIHLGFLITVLVVGSEIELRDEETIAAISLLLGELCVVAAWTALGPEPAYLRLPSGGALCGLIWLVHAAVLPLYDSLWGAVLPLVFLVLVAIGSALRCTRLRLGGSANSSSARRSLIRASFTLITTCAIVVHLVGLGVPWNSDGSAHANVRTQIELAASVAVIFATVLSATMLILLPLTLCRPLADVLHGKWRWGLLLMVLVLCTAPGGVDWALREMSYLSYPNSSWEWITALAPALFLASLPPFFTLIVAGACGCRLDRFPRNSDFAHVMENTDRACVVPGIHRIAFLSAISFGVAVFFSDAVDKMYTRHLAEYVRRDDHSDRWSVTLSALASDKDLRRLPAQKVRGVSFDGSSVTAKGLTALQQLNELSHISFYNVEVGSREIEAILRIPRLTSLHIDGTAIDIADMREISQRQWRFLSLTDADLTDEHVALLGEQRELRSLSISDNPSLTDDSLRVISQFNSLQWLSLDNTSITPKGLEQLAGMHLLELEVPIDAMTDAGFAPYIRATKPLPRYALYDWRILDDALAFLPMETNAISLHRMEITDQGLDNLTRLKALYELDLTGTEITDTGLIYLAELPDLTRLSLCDTNITDDGLTHLVEIPNLVSLSLDRT